MREPLRISGTDIAEGMLARTAAGYPPNTHYLIGFVAASDPAGMSFQKAKQRAADKAGITYRIAALPDGVTQDEAAAEIAAAVSDLDCGGIVIQLPLLTLDTQPLLDLVPAPKDPDVLGKEAYAAFLAGNGVIPPAAGAVHAITHALEIDFAPLTIAVIGQGRLVGAPVSDWLASRCATLHRFDIGFDESLLSSADLVILGTGAYSLDPALLKEGAGVIDFGYRKTESGFAGDLDTSKQEALARLSFYTPTPGGTGPVLIAALVQNFAQLNAST